MPSRAIVAALLRAGLCCTLVACLTAPARAGTATLRRSLQNVAFAPFDLVLAPFVATGAVVRNLGRTEDPPAVRAIFFVPGIAWSTGVQAGASLVREIAGVLELLPGLALLPFERDLPPLFAPAEGNPAWLDWETRALRVKVGVDYTGVPSPD